MDSVANLKALAPRGRKYFIDFSTGEAHALNMVSIGVPSPTLYQTLCAVINDNSDAVARGESFGGVEVIARNYTESARWTIIVTGVPSATDPAITDDGATAVVISQLSAPGNTGYPVRFNRRKFSGFGSFSLLQTRRLESAIKKASATRQGGFAAHSAVDNVVAIEGSPLWKRNIDVQRIDVAHVLSTVLSAIDEVNVAQVAFDNIKAGTVIDESNRRDFEDRQLLLNMGFAAAILSLKELVAYRRAVDELLDNLIELDKLHEQERKEVAKNRARSALSDWDEQFGAGVAGASVVVHSHRHQVSEARARIQEVSDSVAASIGYLNRFPAVFELT